MARRRLHPSLTVWEPSLPLLARRIACHSGVPCHHSWGCEPRSGVEPPTRELHDGFLPCMHSDAMSAAIRGPGAPEAVGGQPLLHGALLELLEGQGLCHSAHPYHVLALLWIVVLAPAKRGIESGCGPQTCGEQTEQKTSAASANEQTEQKMSAASSGERAAQKSSAVPASESAPEIAMQLLSHLQRISC